MATIYMDGHKDYGPLVHYKSNTKGAKPYVKPYPYTRVHLVENDAILKVDRYGRKVGEYTIDLNSMNNHLRMEQGEKGLPRLIRKNMKAGVHNKALSKLDEQLTVASNFFEAWYERREVYKMVGQVGKELLDFATNFRKPKYWKRKGSKAKAPTTLPEAWITYQFGIVPLIGTVDTALKGLGLPLKSASFIATSKDSFSGQMGIGPTGSLLDYTGTYRKSIGCTATPNPNPNVALLNIMGLTTPFSTAWSVIPWGWAIDYFVNVSELLQNVEMKHPGVKTSDWYTTEKWDTEWSGTNYLNFGSPKHEKVVYKLDGKGQVMRRKLTGAQRYQLHLDFPMLGSNKFANLFSALALTMKGKKS